MPDPAPTLSAPSPTLPPPETGLARGRWEAPAWALWGVAAAALVGGIAWLLVALRSRRGPPLSSRGSMRPPPSSRSGRSAR